MKFRNKKVMALLLAMTLCCSVATNAFADDTTEKSEQEKIDEAQEMIDDTQSKIDEAEAQAEALEDQKDSAEAQIAALNEQIAALQAEIEETQTKIDAKVKEIKVAEDEYVQAKLVEEQQYNAMKKRIKYMYEYSMTDELMTAMLASEDLSDMMNKTEYFSTMTTYDKAMNDKYQAIVDEVAAREAALQAEYDELVALQDQMEAEQDSCYALIDEQQALVAQLEEEIGANAAAVQELKEQLKEYEQEKKEQEAARAARIAAAAAAGSAYDPDGAGASQVVGTGQFCNPCPAGRLTSSFGYRSFDNSFHKGIDLACSTGNPVYAVDDGTVLIACYSASAGNWVVISHGNGVVTKYMHNSQIYVTAGQTVSKGQNIAAVGSTGYSTGPHCHFQVEVNGAAVNPYNYL